MDANNKKMPKKNVNLVLWENVLALMKHKYGKEHLTRLAKESGVGGASLTRVKQQETNVGIETVAKIASAFDLQAWHLLTPNLDPYNPPVIWLTTSERDFYNKVKELQQALISTPIQQ